MTKTISVPRVSSPVSLLAESSRKPIAKKATPKLFNQEQYLSPIKRTVVKKQSATLIARPTDVVAPTTKTDMAVPPTRKVITPIAKKDVPITKKVQSATRIVRPTGIVAPTTDKGTPTHKKVATPIAKKDVPRTKATPLTQPPTTIASQYKQKAPSTKATEKRPKAEPFSFRDDEYIPQDEVRNNRKGNFQLIYIILFFDFFFSS